MVGSNNLEVVQKSIKNELTAKEIEKHIFIPGKKIGAHYLLFSGGEFLLRKDSLELVERAVRLAYQPRVLTNGVLINETSVKALKQVGGKNLILVFGINSIHDKKLNKSTRDIELDTVLHNLELCKKHKITRHVVVNVGKYNSKQIEPTLKWLADNRITFNRSPFSARMSGKEYFQSMSSSKKEMQRYIHPALLKRMHGYGSYTPFFLSPELDMEIASGNVQDIGIPQNPPIGCWVGSWIAVNAEGYVSPCVLLLDSVQEGNVRERPLDRIIEESRIFQNITRRDKLKGKCGRCRYKWTCGGCRAIAYYHSGDYMAEDPTCFFEPADESDISPFEKETGEIFMKYLRIAYHAGLYKIPQRGNQEALIFDTYKPGDEKDINKLFNVVFFSNRTLSEWHWKFTDSPRMVIILARDAGKIIGHIGCMLLKLKYFDKSVNIMHAVDYMVHPNYRMGNGNISVRMYQKALEIQQLQDIHCAYAFPNRTGYVGAKRFFKYNDHLKIETHFKRMSWRLAVARRIPSSGIVHAADGISRLTNRVWTKIRSGKGNDGVLYKWVNTLDRKRINRFWETVKDQYDILLRRDYEYLNWRYVRKPDTQYYILQAEFDGEISGVAVVRNADLAHGRAGLIMECLARDAVIIDGLLTRSLLLLSDLKTDYVLCRITSEDNLKRSGFLPRTGLSGEYSICKIFKAPVDEKFFRDNARWHITFGDSDSEI